MLTDSSSSYKYKLEKIIGLIKVYQKLGMSAAGAAELARLQAIEAKTPLTPAELERYKKLIIIKQKLEAEQ